MNTTTSDVQDQADMQRLVQGDDAALNDLMVRHGERLLRYLIRVLQDEAEANDIAQETFSRIYLNRSRFKRGAKFSTWLYTIATNLAHDRQRWHSRHRQVSLDATTSCESDSLKETLPSNVPNAADQLEQAERISEIRKALAALPEELRVPLILSEYENQSHAEIGEVLDCSAKAVEMRIYRARLQLRGSLAHLLKDS